MPSLIALCSRLLLSTLIIAGLITTAHADESPFPKVKVETNKGAIILELNREKAPVSVENFLTYAESGFYDGTIFHRVINNFMIQGGGMTESLDRKETRDPIRNEAQNGLHNTRGTIAMARTQQVNSATSQFFINLQNNHFLNHGSRDFGYAVFGKVVEGMDVVDAIANTPTGRKGFLTDVPRDTIFIESVRLLSEP